MKPLLMMLIIGAAGAVAAASPLASQSSSDARLEAACRSTEIAVPDSCPCTIEKARAYSLSDGELASLFKDDGHSQPVSQAKYGLFWQVKSQCIADATMAQMGISPGNPLPGVPAHMRPGAPLGAAAAQPNPAPNTRAPARPAPSARLSEERKVIPGFAGGPDQIEIKRGAPHFDYFFRLTYRRIGEALAA